MMPSIGIVATVTVNEGMNAQFEEAFGELAAAVRANEPGNNFYELFKSPDNPQVYKVLESYADQAAVDAHMTSEHFKAAGAKLAGVAAGPPKLETLQGV